MYSFSFPVFIIASAIVSYRGEATKHEPSCSRFDYEEKLLEKTIRMELKMEQLVNEIQSAKDDISRTTKDVTKKIEKAEKDILNFQRNINESIKAYSEKFELEKAKLTSLSEKTYIPIIAFSTRLTQSTVKLDVNAKLIFDAVLMNEGEGYNKNTGIFSVSQSGLYFFAVHVCNYGNKAVHHKIVKEGVTIAVSTQYDLDNVFTCNTVSTVVMLQTGERVWVQTTSGSQLYTDGHRWNTFVGVLLNRQII